MKIDTNTVVPVTEIMSYLRQDGYLDKVAAAEYLGVSVRTLEGWMDRLPRYRPGGKSLFRKSELDAFMERHREQPTDVDLERVADEAVASILR